MRFFDFRPGYNFYDCIEAKPKEIRHQHALVPGETYLSFLSAILAFLSRNPKEIAVVELKKDGFVLAEDKHDKVGKLVANSMVPTVEALAEVLQQARKETGNHDVQVAEAKELDSPIGRLIEANKRLFIVDRVSYYLVSARAHPADRLCRCTRLKPGIAQIATIRLLTRQTTQLRSWHSWSSRTALLPCPMRSRAPRSVAAFINFKPRLRAGWWMLQSVRSFWDSAERAVRS